MEGSPKPPASPTNLLEEEEGSEAPVSPEPNCAICLGKAEDKSFTDSCHHQFCFSCLLEWSKVKAECPLCKMKFKTIMHNVRSNSDFDRYHLPTVDAGPSCGVDTFELRPYRNTRASIYQRNLWVNPLPDITGRYQECSPVFYRLNPDEVHSLVPWLNRELAALIPNNTRYTLLGLLLQLFPQFPILSSEFQRQISPFLGGHTAHFMHELYEFARSPYDMYSFDQAAQYEHILEYPVERASDSDSDVVVLPEECSVPSVPPLAANSDGFSPQPSTSGAGNNRYFGRINSDVDSSSSTTTVEVTGEANQGETQVAASDPDVTLHSTYCDPKHKNNMHFTALNFRHTRASIYDDNLWVRPLSNIRGQYWEPSPEFYRWNPAQVHRLVPWLNRELDALLPNNQGHREATYFLIIGLLEKFPIKSEAFRSEVSPFLGGHTSHFMHELHEFARSQYDITAFDEAARYVRISHHTIDVTSSADSDSDVVISPKASTSQRNNVPPHHKGTAEIVTLDSDPQVVEEGEIKSHQFLTSSDSSSDTDYVPKRKMKQPRKKNQSSSRRSSFCEDNIKGEIRKRKNRSSSHSSSNGDGDPALKCVKKTLR